jgi:hypothetical protein
VLTALRSCSCCCPYCYTVVCSSVPLTLISSVSQADTKQLNTMKIIRILKLFQMSNVSAKIMKKLEETIRSVTRQQS